MQIQHMDGYSVLSKVAPSSESSNKRYTLFRLKTNKMQLLNIAEVQVQANVVLINKR